MNIENELLPGEELLYKSDAHPKMVKSHIILFVFIIVFILGAISIMGFFGVRRDIMASFITGFILFAFFPYFVLMFRQVYSIKKSKSNTYFITNKRIFIYNKKTGYTIKNILDIKSIQYSRDNENYGLLKLYTDLDFSEDFEHTISNTIKRILEMINSSFSSSKILFFVGIENPMEAIDAFKKVNPNISVYS